MTRRDRFEGIEILKEKNLKIKFLSEIWRQVRMSIPWDSINNLWQIQISHPVDPGGATRFKTPIRSILENIQ